MSTSAPRDLRLDADLLSLRGIEPWLRGALADGPVDPDALDRVVAAMELALQEICVNIVNHAYGGIEGGEILLRIAFPPGEHAAVVEVVDAGREFVALTDAQVPEEPQVHGYGLVIVQRLTRSFVVERRGSTNVSRATFDLPEPSHHRVEAS